MIGGVELDAVSVIVTVPVLEPAETGLNTTERVQLAPAASEVPQVFDSTKSSVSPPKTMELKVSEAVPLLVSVTDFEAELEPGA